MSENTEKLQKFLARCGLGSRRECETLIASGVVRVNGQVAKVGDRIDPVEDSVKVRNKRVRADLDLQVVMLHKVPGTVCTKKDPEERPTVFTDLPGNLQKLHPVGRLDFHSEGLLLLTNDGDLTLRLTHPRYKLEKTYLVKVRGLPSEADLDKLRGGIRLEGRRTLPCRIRLLEQQKSKHSWLQVGLKEGKKNQIREMFFRIHCPVMRLKRTHIGPLALGKLPRGAVRPLTEREMTTLQQAIKDAKSGQETELPKASAPEPIIGRLSRKERAERKPPSTRKAPAKKKSVKKGPKRAPKPGKGGNKQKPRTADGKKVRGKKKPFRKRK